MTNENSVDWINRQKKKKKVKKKVRIKERKQERKGVNLSDSNSLFSKKPLKIVLKRK